MRLVLSLAVRVRVVCVIAAVRRTRTLARWFRHASDKSNGKTTSPVDTSQAASAPLFVRRLTQLTGTFVQLVNSLMCRFLMGQQIARKLFVDTLGTLEFTLEYDDNKQSLTVGIIKATVGIASLA